MCHRTFRIHFLISFVHNSDLLRDLSSKYRYTSACTTCSSLIFYWYIHVHVCSSCSSRKRHLWLPAQCLFEYTSTGISSNVIKVWNELSLWRDSIMWQRLLVTYFRRDLIKRQANLRSIDTSNDSIFILEELLKFSRVERESVIP